MTSPEVTPEDGDSHHQAGTVDSDRRDIRSPNKALVHRWVDAGNRHDVEEFDSIFAVDVIDHVTGNTGIPPWKQMWTRLLGCFPDWHAEVDYVVSEDDFVVVRFVAHGTHQGSDLPMLTGIEPRGRAFTWTHHHCFRTRSGRLQEHWANRDDLGLINQLRGEPGH